MSLHGLVSELKNNLQLGAGFLKLNYSYPVIHHLDAALWRTSNLISVHTRSVN